MHTLNNAFHLIYFFVFCLQLDSEDLQTTISEKDLKLTELTDRIVTLEQQLLEFKELVDDKDRVISGKDQAVQVR